MELSDTSVMNQAKGSEWQSIHTWGGDVFAWSRERRAGMTA